MSMDHWQSLCLALLAGDAFLICILFVILCGRT
jgi:hypothetical protein